MHSEVLLKVNNKKSIEDVEKALLLFASLSITRREKGSSGWYLYIAGTQNDLREFRSIEIGKKAKVKNEKGDFYSPAQSMSGWARSVTPLPNRANGGGAFSNLKK